MKRSSFPILGILLPAFLVRLWGLDARPIWYDEAFSVFLAEHGPTAIVSGTAADTMPPGYYLLLYGWMNLVGQTPFALRMLSVGLSLVTLALVYAVAKRAFGSRAALWSLFLIALMPFQLYHAQELRMYTLLGLGVLLYVYGVLVLSLKTENTVPTRAIACIAVGTLIALYAHNLAFAALLSGNAYFLVRRAWRKQAQLILGEFFGAIFFTPWLFYLPTQLDKIQRAFWTSRPGVLEVVQMVVEFTTHLPLPPPLIAFALILSVLVLVFTVWQLVKMTWRKTVPAVGLLVALALIPPILMLILSYLIRPVFVPRGAIASALLYAILVGAVIARGGRRVQRVLAMVVLVVAGVLLPFYYSAYGEWRRAPYIQADAFLRSDLQAGDVILHDNKLSFFPMHFYDRMLSQAFLADPAQSDNDTFAPASQAAMQLYPTDFEQAIQDKSRVWFVIYQTAISEANGDHANLARLDAKFRRVQESDYGDLRIYLYTAR